MGKRLQLQVCDAQLLLLWTSDDDMVGERGSSGVAGPLGIRGVSV